MKKTLFFFLLGAMALVQTACSSANAESEFWVRGNCEMCKQTIETALTSVDGVSSAEYNLENNMASVAFDSAKVDEKKLSQAVANAGYDTKGFKASQAAYQELPKCCKKPEDM